MFWKQGGNHCLRVLEVLAEPWGPPRLSPAPRFLELGDVSTAMILRRWFQFLD